MKKSAIPKTWKTPLTVAILRALKDEKVAEQFQRSKYFSHYHARKLNDWLFKEYGAQLIQEDSKFYLQFLDEHTMTLFLLTWS